MFKNQVCQCGKYAITEEVNCYIVWLNINALAVYYFNDIQTKDESFELSKNYAQHLNDNE